MRVILVALWALSAAAGCGPSGPAKYPIKGGVTFDGEPLKQGYIVFRPTSPGTQPDGAEIKEGHYDLRAMAGEMRVEITAERETGKVGRKKDKLMENYIPKEYNTATKLKVEVTTGAANNFDFELKSKP